MKKLISIGILFVILIGIGIFLKLSYDKALVEPNSNSTDKVEFVISSGESTDEIIRDLVDKDLLREEWSLVFKVYLKLNDLSKDIQAGTYHIPKDLNIAEIVETIQHAKNQDLWITIPEGLRKDEIATLIEKEFKSVGSNTFSSTEFLSLALNKEYISTLSLGSNISNLEGYLYPDKYAFDNQSTTKQVMEKLTSTFKSKVGNISYDKLIIASLLEREGYNSEDRAMISDVIKKRLEEGWLLQIDATLLYIPKDWKHVITQTDKDSDNAYNTYKKTGLPPTPICNPGLESITAALNPKSNPYYYYIHDSNGVAHYGKTLTEHNQNIQTYLR